MSHEPCRAISHAQHAVQLMGTDGFFGRTQDEQLHEPLAQPDMAVLEYRTNGDGELVAARRAFVKPLAGRGLAGLLGREFINLVVLAMRPYRAIRPAQRFEQRTRLL